MDPNNINNLTQTRNIPPPHAYALSGKIMLSAIVFLFSVVLIILFVHLYVRWRVYRRRLRRRRNPLIFTSSGNQSLEMSRGVDPTVIKSLHVSFFSAGDLEDDDVAECAVCLNEFVEREKIRMLPRCGHRFHVACIDMWFGSHNSCPLCRYAVEIEASRESTGAVTDGNCAGSSSETENREVRIEVGRREEEVVFGLGFGRILGIKRFLSADLRRNSGERDIERGEAAAAAAAAAATE